MIRTGFFDFEITYSERYGDSVINKRTVTMKSCFSKKHALDRFNVYIYGSIDDMTDIYIHEIRQVN